MTKFILLIFLITIVNAKELILPIPLEDDVNIEKANLGKLLFSEKALSKDRSTSCMDCHDISTGGADKRVVSRGYADMEGDIQSPTVSQLGPRQA